MFQLGHLTAHDETETVVENQHQAAYNQDNGIMECRIFVTPTQKTPLQASAPTFNCKTPNVI